VADDLDGGRLLPQRAGCSYIVNGHATLHAICALLALTAAIVWWVNRTPRNKDEG
jgi:hypothetical protein